MKPEELASNIGCELGSELSETERGLVDGVHHAYNTATTIEELEVARMRVSSRIILTGDRGLLNGDPEMRRWYQILLWSDIYLGFDAQRRIEKDLK
ncbi:hypothetical protein H6770_02825 [Candidatus Peribacteria bacterium]|nr:hypothetical protein [Candidatus Peribacteria bacterium]